VRDYERLFVVIENSREKEFLLRQNDFVFRHDRASFLL
jgi:hypothetical protein